MNHLLIVITPTKRSEQEVAWVEIDTPQGNQIIQAHHEPLIALLKPHSLITFETSQGKQETLEILGGIIEVTRKQTTIIADQLA